MRKVIVKISLSLDGFIEERSHWLQGGQTGRLSFEEDVRYVNNFLKGFDTIFYGRIAYEKLGLPRTVEESQPEVEREFNYTINTIRKYVFSHKAKHVPGNGMVINDNLLAEVKRIREEDGKNIWLWGGAGIVKTFTDLDLIDEYIFAVQPTVSGSGKPLFQNMKRHLNLRLLDVQNLTSGTALLYCQPENRINNKHAL